MEFEVGIYDNQNNLKRIVKNLYPLNQAGMVLRYSRELSAWGKCRFRVPTEEYKDFNEDIFLPHKYKVRIAQGQNTLWEGYIVDNPRRNTRFIEISAVEPLYYLSKILIQRDTESIAGDGTKHFRVFKSGTLADAVTDVFNQAKADAGDSHPLSTITLGDVENPPFPEGFKNPDGSPLTGEWTFSDSFSIQFDYHSAYYVIYAFGIYSGYDFLVKDNVFYFKKRVGDDKSITYYYGEKNANLIDYELPRLGGRVENNIFGIAATDDGVILHANVLDAESVADIGLMQGADAFADVKNANILKQRLSEELRRVKKPEESPTNITIDQLIGGDNSISPGDSVVIRVDDGIIQYNERRMVVGITANYHNTGRKISVIQTNKMRE